jgi:hypothetical protein
MPDVERVLVDPTNTLQVEASPRQIRRMKIRFELRRNSHHRPCARWTVEAQFPRPQQLPVKYQAPTKKEKKGTAHCVLVAWQAQLSNNTEKRAQHMVTWCVSCLATTTKQQHKKEGSVLAALQPQPSANVRHQRVLV